MRNHREDPQLGALIDRYVTPDRRYGTLLHGNVLHLDDAHRVSFGRALAEDARRITDDELENLLNYEWRAQLTAAWLAAITRRTNHRERIGELLVASRLTYAGQGFCFALARFGTPQDAQLLDEYLGRYLPQLELSYDQPWAMGALLHIDAQLGTHHADQFLSATGAWQRWIEALPSRRSDPETQRRLIDDLSSFADMSAKPANGPDTPE